MEKVQKIYRRNKKNEPPQRVGKKSLRNVFEQQVNLKKGKVLQIHNDREKGAWYNQKENAEIVVYRVLAIGRLEDKLDEIESGERRGEEEDLHCDIVHGREVPKEIQIPTREDNAIELLGFERNP